MEDSQERTHYNPTCAATGERTNLEMYPIRNEKDEMIGWVFLNEKVNRNDIELNFSVNPKEA